MDKEHAQDFFKKILNDQEIAELERFNESPALQSAIKKVILSAIYHEGVLKSGEMPDVGFNFLLVLANSNNDYTPEHLGNDLKARVKACQLLEMGYKALADFKKFVIPTRENTNPAR